MFTSTYRVPGEGGLTSEFMPGKVASSSRSHVNMSQDNEAKKPAATEDNHEVGHVHGPNCSHHHHEPIVREAAKIGRNDPCPCGSKQKYKKCHGK